MNKILIILLVSAGIFTSCTKDQPDPGATSSVSMANEWWVHVYLNGTQITTGSPKHFYTYNTAANNDQMWFDDRNTLPAAKRFKTMVTANYSALTFSATSTDNIGQAAVAGVYKKVTITNGKILKGVGHSRTNNVTDSLFLNIVYSDDPTNTYTVTGHARTFFIDDDY